MIDFTHYIKARSIADTYLQHIRDLNGTSEKQHFMVRLSLCNGYKNLLSDNKKKAGLFKWMYDDLKKKLKMSWDELWEDSLNNDDKGYRKEIGKIDNEDIKFYFGMIKLISKSCILLRGGMELPEEIEKKITRKNLIRMIDIANNDEIIREHEATMYVNGIGNIMCLKWLKNNLVPIDWDHINKCYDKIFEYYINTCSVPGWIEKSSKHTLHNRIYGLTHCIINLSNFYTRPVDTKSFDEKPDIAKRILNDIIDSQKNSNYKIFNDDTLAEMLLCVKLCGGEYDAERIAALDALSLRFDSQKLIFDEYKCDSFKEELLMNEHTNILYILNVLL